VTDNGTAVDPSQAAGDFNGPTVRRIFGFAVEALSLRGGLAKGRVERLGGGLGRGGVGVVGGCFFLFSFWMVLWAFFPRKPTPARRATCSRCNSYGTTRVVLRLPAAELIFSFFLCLSYKIFFFIGKKGVILFMREGEESLHTKTKNIKTFFLT